MIDLEDARSLDAADPLALFRDQFVIDDTTVCYLDGNSLGRLPKSAADAVNRVVREQWGRELVTGWSHWIDISQRVGDLIGSTVLGAEPGQTLATDTTSVNLYRLAIAAVQARPGRSTIVIDEANFPTDRYIFQGIASTLGLRLVTIPNESSDVAPMEQITPELLDDFLNDDVALVCLQVVNYRSGARQDVPALTEIARRYGAFLLWDASHAVGSIDLAFDDWGVDLAVGCTYKYCNGGPGAPAWLYVRAETQSDLQTPIDGWFAQANQFEMGPNFERAPGIRGFHIATPPVVALSAVEASLMIIAEAGITAIEAKCARGTQLMVDLFDQWLEPLEFTLETPRDARSRGGHVSLAHPDAAQIAQALRELANVIPDFRQPNTIRVAVAPLYTSYEEIYQGFSRIRELVEQGRYKDVQPIHGGVT